MRADVEITISRIAESRRLTTYSVGLDMTTKLEHRIPPPIFWAQNPCFLEFTGRVALQNIENKEVPYKIFPAKELRDISGRFRLECGVNGRAGIIGGKASKDYCAQSKEIICKELAVQAEARYSLAEGL